MWQPSSMDDGDRVRTPPLDVQINIVGRSRMTCVLPVQHSAQPRLDNCYRDQAVTNAAQLADLLSREDVPVVAPSG